MTVTPTNPLSYNLTEKQIIADGGEPLYVGTTVTWRFQYRDSNNAAVSLTGYTIKMTIKTSSGATYTRTSGVAITGAAPAANEITPDADQTTETGDTGKGWYGVNFAATAAEVTAQTLVAGKGWDYDIVLKASNGAERTHLKGKVDVILLSCSMPI